MREITRVKREKVKKVFQLKDHSEFLKGEWLKEVPNSLKVELTYFARNGILIINDTPNIEVKNQGEGYIDREGEKDG